MSKDNKFKITSSEEDPIKDATEKIKMFWVKAGSPSIQKIVSSIEINGKEYEFLMMNDPNGGDVTIIIK
tara:strand:+ start:78 stop:284 length:207 start_codon:yes stop_codon:yes gene_type:complete